MPASSVSAMNSWGIYLISSAALVLIMLPSLQQISTDTRISADWREIDGVYRIINSLKPGMTVHLKLESNSTDGIQLGGHEIFCNYGTGVLIRNSSWLLPDYTIKPGVAYFLTLSGWRVEVRNIV